MAPKEKKTKEQIAKAAAAGSKGKKKKWNKGKSRDRLQNAVLFDKNGYERFMKEVPGFKVITPAIVSERLKIRGSLARRALAVLCDEGVIEKVFSHHTQYLYTKAHKN